MKLFEFASKIIVFIVFAALSLLLMYNFEALMLKILLVSTLSITIFPAVLFLIYRCTGKIKIEEVESESDEVSSVESLNSITSTNLENLELSEMRTITIFELPPIYDTVTTDHSDENSSPPPSYTAATSQV